MFSFIGWEAVSRLAGELRDPARQLPRAILSALAVVVVLYLGLAVATVGVLGTSAPSDVPLADLMAAGLGDAGRTVTAALAVLLTMGTMNAYVAAAVKLAGALAAERSAPPLRPAGSRARAVRRGALLLAPLGTGLLDDDAVRASSAWFVAVYATATAAGVRLLGGRRGRGRGRARRGRRRARLLGTVPGRAGRRRRRRAVARPMAPHAGAPGSCSPRSLNT